MIQLTLDRVVLEKLLHQAAAASRLIADINDNVDGAVPVGPLADQVNEIAHTLTELLGDPAVVGPPAPNACSAFPGELEHHPERASSKRVGLRVIGGSASRFARMERPLPPRWCIATKATRAAIRLSTAERNAALLALVLLGAIVVSAIGATP